MSNRKKQVLIIIPWTQNIAREIFAGVVDFVRSGHRWKLHHLSSTEMLKSPPTNLDYFDGIIGRIGFEPLAKQVIKASSCPVVNVHGGDPLFDLPQIGEDDRAIGALAADYLYQLDLRLFAYTSVPGINSLNIRTNSFAKRLTELGVQEKILTLSTLGSGNIQNDLKKLKVAQKKYGTPVGIFCADDWRASLLEDQCQDAGIRMPQEAAILGVNNDPLFCQTYEVELSSIRLPMRKIGFTAGQMLDRLMQGKPLKKKVVRFAPEGVVPRFSTEILRIRDPLIQAAILIIEKEYIDSLKTGDIARRTGVSQRTLEQRFHDVLHLSPQRVIRNRRIEQAKKLLQDTDLRMNDIAVAVGLNDNFYFSQIFKKETGIAPTEYRKTFRTAG